MGLTRRVLAVPWAKVSFRVMGAISCWQRRGDDGLTDRERRRLAAHYQATVCARPTTEELDVLSKLIAQAMAGGSDAQ